MRIEALEINNVKYTLKISFEDRPNTSASIRGVNINLRIPLGLNREEQFRELLKMKQWAIKKIRDNPPKIQQKRGYQNGETLKVGDAEYKLNIDFSSKQSSSIRLVGDSLFLNISSDIPQDTQNKHISSLLSRIIARQRLPKLKERVTQLNEAHFNQKLNKIFFKNNKSNWGSCSLQGNINISTRLLFAPDDVLEYICVHELSHLIEHNHSDNFWALVEKAMPDYREKETWLKENGDKCVF